jgi:hypothetical protein
MRPIPLTIPWLAEKEVQAARDRGIILPLHPKMDEYD